MAVSIRIVLGAIGSVCAFSVFATSHTGIPHVTRAIEAQGGESALGQLRTVAIRGSHVSWEIQSSYQAGKAAEPRQGSEAKFVIQRDLTDGRARIDWDRRVVRTPKPLIQKYSEIVTDGIGYVNGIDSAARTDFSRKANPPGHPMSGARLATTLRELTRQSPRLTLDMKNNPGAVTALPAQTVDGNKYPAVRYNVRDWSYIVMFDPKTRLPARIRTRDGDPIQGDSNYDLVLSDWRDVGGVKIAHSQTYQLDGRDILVTKYEQITPNATLSADLFEIPTPARLAAVRAAMGNVPHQWIIRRGQWGNLLDSDLVAWDPNVEPQLVEIAPGVSLSQGVSHNSMVVEMEKYLVVFDAPIGEQFSEWFIDAAKKRYPGKPIRYLMLTHHHWDHSSGMRSYGAEGATFIVGKGLKEHVRHTLSAPGTVLDDRLNRSPRKPNVIEVEGKHVLKDGKREVHMYHIDSKHSIATLIGYIPDASLGFVTDIFSTNVPLPPKASAGHVELVQGTKKWGITPERFAPGHGSVAPFAPLVKLVEGR
jgi:glyoxylase-like metal-dependent hydrolase (beta-lactamase superfamily II)